MPPRLDNPTSGLVDPVLFTKRLEFAGVFRDGELATKPLSVEISYSSVNAHPPIGIIRGTAADWPELEAFFHKRHSPLSQLESVSLAEGREKIRSRELIIREINLRRYPTDESNFIQQILGRFEPLDITIECDNGQRATRDRRMTFLVRGPTLVWTSDAIRSFSYSGNIKTEFPRANLRISGARDLRSAVQPYFLYASRPGAERAAFSRADEPGTRLSIEAEAFALTIIDRDLDRTDACFEARAIEVAELLNLLVSFLSKGYVTWYAYTLWSDRKLVENYRAIQETLISRLRWEDIILHPKDIRTFISKAFTAYHKVAHEGVNLRLPILLYVAAQSGPTVEERFILLFRCLEKVVDTLDQGYAWELLTSDELAIVAKSLRTQLKSMGKDDETVEVVNAKTRELTRPAFRHRLFRHLDRLKIDLSDIGGGRALTDTIKIRNSLIHAAEEAEISLIVQERKRLETVVERVLLTLLDWRGLTNTPTYANRSIGRR